MLMQTIALVNYNIFFIWRFFVDLFSVFSFLFLIGFVALLSYKITTRVKIDDKDGYFLGGRSLTGVVIAASILLTNLSTEQLVGLNGQGYMFSMIVMSWETGGALALIIIAAVFLPKYLKSGITTIPAFLEKRYDKNTKQIVSTLFIFGYTLTYLPTVLCSGALVINKLFNIPAVLGLSEFHALFVTVFAIGIVGSLYAILGGLRAVAVSDTINGVMFIIGTIMIPILALKFLGGGAIINGIEHLVTHNPEKLNSIGSWDSVLPFALVFGGLMFNNLFYFGTNQSIVQRMLAAKNLKEAQKGAILCGFLKLFGPFTLVLPGIIAFHLYPNLKFGDMAYPTLIKDVLPPYLVGFFAAVLVGAIISSFNSALNSTVTLFSLDIYKPSFKPDISDKDLIKVGRRLGMFLTLISMTIGPFIIFSSTGLYGYLQATFGFYSMPILAIFVVGIISKRASAYAAKRAIIIYVIMYGAYMFSGTTINFLYVLTIYFPATIIIIMLLSKIKPREKDFVLEYTHEVDITPWKHLKLVSVLLVLAVTCIYLLFSSVGVDVVKQLIGIVKSTGFLI